MRQREENSDQGWTLINTNRKWELGKDFNHGNTELHATLFNMVRVEVKWGKLGS